MEHSPPGSDSRREFIRDCTRYFTLGTLGLIAYALRSGRRGTAAGERCVNAGVCRGCGRLSACGLPQALSAKSVTGRDALPALESEGERNV